MKNSKKYSNRIHVWLLVLIINIGSWSCETVLDVDVPYDQTSLVVNGILQNGQHIELAVTKDEHILADNDLSFSDFQAVEGARVVLEDDGQTFVGIEEDGVYTFPFEARPGRLYEIRVEKEGFQTVTATAQMPTAFVLPRDISYAPGRSAFGSEGIDLRFNIQDSPGISDFYELIVAYEISEPMDEIIRDTIYTSPDSTEFFVNVYRPFDNFGVANIKFGDRRFIPYYIEIKGSDLDESPAVYGRSVYFSDELFDGKNRQIELFVESFERFNTDGSGTSEDNIFIFVRNCTEDYFNYLTSVDLQEFNEGDPFAQPVIVEGNIANGYGLFSGFVQTGTKLE